MMESQKENLVSNEEKSQLVQMRLKPKTLQLIDSISELTNTTNRTQIISSASIQLAEEIVKNMEDGNKVYIEDKDGKRSFLKIIGI